MAKEHVRLVFLGGLGEIGRNCLALECAGRIIVIDAGLMFPEPDMYGVDIILPDFTWLAERADKVDAICLTHGHEDHTGALGYLTGLVRAPVYGAPLTLGFAKHRLTENKRAGRVTWREVRDGERVEIGPFGVEFIPVTHSVPSAHALAVHTPAGVLVHSGDFKLDLTPIDGRRTDVARLAALGDEGVAVLLADSTNAEEPGFTPSESAVGASLRRLFLERPDRRIVVACFASHLHRISQIAHIAGSLGRRVVLLGRSMDANVGLGRKLRALDLPPGLLEDADNIDRYGPGELCVICTGSQGEPLSALARMSRKDNRFLLVGENDTVILSSHPIPGNEWSVGRVIDDLYRAGAEVIDSSKEFVHASGHARQGELRTLQQLVRPKHFVPIHGEYRHLVHHARIAREMGVAPNRVLVCEDGDVLELSATGLRRHGRVPAGFHYVSGDVGDLDAAPLEERRRLAEHGVVLVSAAVDRKRHAVVNPARATARGWFEGRTESELLNAAGAAANEALADALRQREDSDDALNKAVQRAVGRVIGQRFRRQPLVLPAITVVG